MNQVFPGILDKIMQSYVNLGLKEKEKRITINMNKNQFKNAYYKKLNKLINEINTKFDHSLYLCFLQLQLSYEFFRLKPKVIKALNSYFKTYKWWKYFEEHPYHPHFEKIREAIDDENSIIVNTTKKVFEKNGIHLQKETIKELCYYFHDELVRLAKKNDLHQYNIHQISYLKDDINFSTISQKLNWLEENAESRCQLIIYTILEDIEFDNNCELINIDLIKYKDSQHNPTNWDNNIQILEDKTIYNIVNSKSYVDLNEKDYEILNNGTKKLLKLNKEPKLWHKFHENFNNQILKNKLIWFFGMKKSNIHCELPKKLIHME